MTAPRAPGSVRGPLAVPCRARRGRRRGQPPGRRVGGVRTRAVRSWGGSSWPLGRVDRSPWVPLAGPGAAADVGAHLYENLQSPLLDGGALCGWLRPVILKGSLMIDGCVCFPNFPVLAGRYRGAVAERECGLRRERMRVWCVCFSNFSVQGTERLRALEESQCGRRRERVYARCESSPRVRRVLSGPVRERMWPASRAVTSRASAARSAPALPCAECLARRPRGDSRGSTRAGSVAPGSTRSRIPTWCAGRMSAPRHPEGETPRRRRLPGPVRPPPPSQGTKGAPSGALHPVVVFCAK
jgi:hypothetical protein